jgi:hypothetical protein
MALSLAECVTKRVPYENLRLFIRLVRGIFPFSLSLSLSLPFARAEFDRLAEAGGW